MSGVALVLPPGWTLHPGGPHIALPLLKGFLQRHNIETRVYDLNIGAVKHHKIYISQNDAFDACNSLTRPSMNTPYFFAEDRLQQIALQYDATWFAQEGYRRNGCILSSAQSVREYSCLESPFTSYFNNVSIPEILKHNPKIVGITLIVPSQILPAFEFVRLLRQSGYDGCVVLGGNIITRIYGDMALDWVFDLVDGVIQLQGEQTLLDLYHGLESGSDLTAIPNLMWRSPEGIISNKSEQLKPVDFAEPDFSDIEVRDYWGTNYLTMLAARGCYYGKCTFCAIPFGYGKNNYIGASPAHKVIHSMQECYKQYGINRFKFVDEAFHPKLMKDLIALIEETGFKCTFEGYFRLESSWLQPNFLRSCYQAGLRKMYIGLELIPSEERDLLAKADGADPLQFLSLIKEIGIKAHVFCMFGFPGTGVKEAFQTIEFALEHHELVDTLDVFPFYYARHTKVEGVEIIPDPDCTWNVEHRYRPIDSTALPPNQVNILAEQLSDVIWGSQPQWLHPIYRMYSPWQESFLRSN